MAKFLIVGDIHYRGTNPRARKDNFTEALRTKLLEVNIIAMANRVDAILQTGDLFDSPGVGYAITADFAQVLSESGIRWYCVAGNHDEFGASIQSLPRTPLGLLHSLEVVTLVDSDNSGMFIQCRDGQEILLLGTSYCHETDSAPEWYAGPNRAFDNVRATINIAHGMLLDKPFGYEIRHQTIGNIPNPADVTVVGHEHTGFGAVCRPDGKWFINPGALGRLSASAAEMERTIQVALMEITPQDITVQLIPLKSARPASEVLSREHLEEAHARDERLETFLRLLASEGEAKYLEVREIIEDLASRENLPPAVVAEALGRIGQAREAMAGRGA